MQGQYTVPSTLTSSDDLLSSAVSPSRYQVEQPITPNPTMRRSPLVGGGDTSPSFLSGDAPPAADNGRACINRIFHRENIPTLQGVSGVGRPVSKGRRWGLFADEVGALLGRGADQARRDRVELGRSSLRRHLTDQQERERASGSSPTFAIFADRAVFKSGHKRPHKGGARRGVCAGFSPGSRRNMMRQVASMRLTSRKSGLATLTYPKKYDNNPRAWKRDLDVFKKRLDRYAARHGIDIVGFWRLELQKRGAPHFHLLIAWTNKLPRLFKRWLSKAWYEIVASGDEKHLLAGTNFKLFDNRGVLRGYVSKYVAKLSDGVESSEMGRHWGKIGKPDITPYIEGEMSPEQFTKARRYIRKALKARVASYKRPKRAKKYLKYLAQADTINVLDFGVESSDNPVIGRIIDALLR